MRSRFTLTAGALAAALVLSACGGGDDGGDAGGSGKLEGRGPITYVQGKDTSGGFVQKTIDKWNADHPDEQVKLIELPESADAQRQQMIQNAQTKASTYTILSLDVVWTAEFAANGWVDELPADAIQEDKLLEPTVATAKYFDKLYAAPHTSDGGMLYYRKDLLDAAGLQAPKTFNELKAACDKIRVGANARLGCFAGQYQKYEGLTVNFAEAVQSAGGEIVTADGKVQVDSSEAKEGLNFLVDGFKNGTIPRAAITYKEEEGRRAFQAGELIFHRQWPYQYQLANATDGSSKVAGKFAVAPLPGFDGPGSSSLGGHNMAISKFAKNKATALDFIKFYTSEENQRANLEATSQAPTLESLYDDPALKQKYPYLDTLKASILSAEPRPVAVKYGDVTTAIQNEVYAALQGTKSPEDALSSLQTKLEELTKK